HCKAGKRTEMMVGARRLSRARRASSLPIGEVFSRRRCFPPVRHSRGEKEEQMTTAAIKPWLENVALHPDVLSENFSEDVFALDLGPLSDCLIAKELKLSTKDLLTVPAVYRDPENFFRASYLTTGLRSLLANVLDRLAGGSGNRVLKLVTAFGGGKSHTLA